MVRFNYSNDWPATLNRWYSRVKCHRGKSYGLVTAKIPRIDRPRQRLSRFNKLQFRGVFHILPGTSAARVWFESDDGDRLFSSQPAYSVLQALRVVAARNGIVHALGRRDLLRSITGGLKVPRGPMLLSYSLTTARMEGANGTESLT